VNLGERIRKWAVFLTVAAIILNSVALYMVFFYAPTEVQMGDVQKIFYYHVPCAISAYLMLFVSFVMSIAFLSKGKLGADIWAHSGAEVGLVFILCVLITGPIWGRSAWGKWWVWEPRLTTFLVLFLMYISYILLRLFGTKDAKTARVSAILSIIAFLDVPLVNRAIAWWGSVVHPRRVALEPQMKHTLLVSFPAVFVLAAAILLWRVYISYEEKAKEDMAG
jgi:heme exporter protein C